MLLKRGSNEKERQHLTNLSNCIKMIPSLKDISMNRVLLLTKNCVVSRNRSKKTRLPRSQL